MLLSLLTNRSPGGCTTSKSRGDQGFFAYVLSACVNVYMCACVYMCMCDMYMCEYVHVCMCAFVHVSATTEKPITRRPPSTGEQLRGEEAVCVLFVHECMSAYVHVMRACVDCVHSLFVHVYIYVHECICAVSRPSC